jgi:tetratricopeptide (TPR) repeat protein
MATPEELIRKGDEFLRAGQLDAAEHVYKKALNLDPNNAEILYSIGCVFLQPQRQEFEKALHWAERAVAADPEHKAAWALKGNILLGLERYEEALEALKAALGGPNDIMLRGQMGICCEHLEKWTDAEAYLRAALEKDVTYVTRFAAVGLFDYNPFYADCHHALSRVLEKLGNLEEARLHARLARTIDRHLGL